MNCRQCGYDFDPSRGLECPRCGTAVDCTAVACEECDGCTVSLDGFTDLLAGRTADEEQG